MDVGSSSDEGQIFSSSSEEMEDLLEFIEVKSKRGSSLLTRDGFEYQFERYSVVDNQVEYWKCPKRPPYCPGRIHVASAWHEGDGNRFKIGWIKNANHSHNAEPYKKVLPAHPEILPGDDEEATYGDGCDGWLRAWINHEQIAHRDALFPIQIKECPNMKNFNNLYSDLKKCVLHTDNGREFENQYIHALCNEWRCGTDENKDSKDIEARQLKTELFEDDLD
uniref:FLYWCH-type domain-containing protein n=1 Tax=Meloidogyne javanica TaxID=6303 RepID=A0A915NBJ3_MELJA